MSHIATIALEVKDLDALDVAAKRCGIALMRGQKQYRTYGGHLRDCEHAIVLPDTRAYEIGIVARTDGRPGFSLAFDAYNGGKGMMAQVGDECSLLKKEYAVAVARKQAVAQGFRITEQRAQDGSIRMALSR